MAANRGKNAIRQRRTRTEKSANTDSLEQESVDTSESKNVNERKSTKRQWIACFVLLSVFCCCRSVVADWMRVPTGSMKPTIYEGDRIFVNKLAYGLRVPFTEIRVATLGQPTVGEVVVFPEPKSGKRYVKRVVGLAGDRVELKQNRVYVNGEMANSRPCTDEEIAQFENMPAIKDWRIRHLEPNFFVEHLGTSDHVMQTLYDAGDFGPIVVPEGQVFVMGDNRDQSLDSRFIGCISTDTLVGRATHVAWSNDHDNYYLFRRNRFFKPLDEF